MNTVTVEYNPNNKVATGLINVLYNVKGVHIKNYTPVIEEESDYNPEFVEEILRSRASKGIKIKLEDLWK